METLIDIGAVRVNKIDERTSSSDDTYSHCSEKFSIVYIVEGQGKCTVEGVPVEFYPRTAMILRPYVFCNFESGDKTPLFTYSVEFDFEFLTGDAPSKLNDILNRQGVQLSYDYRRTEDGINMLMDQMPFVSVMPKEQKQSYVQLLVSQLVILINSAEDIKAESESYDLGARVVEYLNDNCIGNRISLDEVAKRFFVSKYYLCRAFKKHNGISVHGYINRKKIMYAKELIESGQTASSVAYKVGYGDYSAFYRSYVKITGKSPTEQ